MKSVVILEKCLLSRDRSGVLEFVNSMEPRTANEKMRAFAYHFKLKTVEIGGILYSHVVRASLVLGYSDPSSLVQLLSTYQIQAPKIGWFEVETRTRIREAFNLAAKDSQATLIGWAGILVAGMSGRTSGADKIRLYMYSMEMAGSAALDSRDELAKQKLIIHKAKAVCDMASQYERSNDPAMKSIIGKQLESVTGDSIPEPKQRKLSLVEDGEQP